MFFKGFPNKEFAKIEDKEHPLSGTRSLNEQDLRKFLGFFKVPQASIESIRSKLVFKVFDEYVVILKACIV